MTAENTTREQLLDAAEELIAESGPEGATLRAITGRAGANLAAVNYHFGSKDGLVQAVLLRHIHPVNQERLRLMDDLAADAPVEAVLDTFFRPAFQMVSRQEERWPIVHRVMGRMLAHPTAYQDLFHEEFAPVIARVMALLRARLPGADPASLFFRLNFSVGGMIHYMRCGHLLTAWSRGACDGDDRERALAELVRFTAAGLSAPGGSP